MSRLAPPAPSESGPLLTVRGLYKRFAASRRWSLGRREWVHAVRDVGFTLATGGSLGIVGESGCGKSTLARCLVRLAEADAGEIVFDGVDVRALRGAALRDFRRRAQIILQDPFASLNPKQTIGGLLAEPLRVHTRLARREIAQRVAAILAEVGLPADGAQRYPHEFSGGQRQRISIARGLILEPTLIVADEPVSALDVSVQAQVLTLLGELRRRRGLSFVFVSHDLGVVRQFCDSVVVMYFGAVVESGRVPDIFEAPRHPYTRLLREAVPVPDTAARHALPRVDGEVPSPLNPPGGCPFRTRCPEAMPVCARVDPRLRPAGDGALVACHLYPDTSPAAPSGGRPA